MMRPLIRRWRGRHGDEEGMAIVTVLLAALVLLGIGVISVNQAQRAMHSTTGHLSFEQAIHLAETGVDQALARLQHNPDWVAQSALTRAYPTGADDAAEEAWAREQLLAAPVVTLEEGQYALVKVANRNVVYTAGWAPSKAEAERGRFVKAEYLFSSYSPPNAVLTNGDLDIGGNASVQGSLGNVHANGSIDVVGNSLTVSGTVSATGTISGGQAGWAAGAPPQDVPPISPREIYDVMALRPDYSSDWYDLCPDGSVRQPAAGGPCTGTILSASGEFRGWTLTGTNWRNDRSPYDGVYYIHEGTAKIRGTNAQLWRATIIAAASGEACSLNEGDIEMTGNPRIAGFLPDIALIAGRDIDIQGTGSGDGNYEGLIASHEQFKVTGNPTLYGALVSEDACDSSGSPVDDNYVSGSMVITHNDGLEVDLGDIVRNTLWLEY